MLSFSPWFITKLTYTVYITYFEKYPENVVCIAMDWYFTSRKIFGTPCSYLKLEFVMLNLEVISCNQRIISSTHPEAQPE